MPCAGPGSPSEKPPKLTLAQKLIHKDAQLTNAVLANQAAHSASVALAATASTTTSAMIGENGAVLYKERAFLDISTATLTSKSSDRNRGVILGAANGFWYSFQHRSNENKSAHV